MGKMVNLMLCIFYHNLKKEMAKFFGGRAKTAGNKRKAWKPSRIIYDVHP